MALRRDVRQRIVAGDVEAAQKLLQQQRPQLLAIPPAPRPASGFGSGFGAASPALVADPADGVLLDDEASGREDEMEDGEMGRGGGALAAAAPASPLTAAQFHLWSHRRVFAKPTRHLYIVRATKACGTACTA